MAKNLLRDNGLFQNPYRLAGMIYTTNQKDSTRQEIYYMNGTEMVKVFYRSAGVTGDE